jgi:hypothetical protein
MARRHVNVILRWIIFAIAGVVGLLAIAVVLGPTVRSWQLARAITRFEEHPSQRRADSLVELLQLHAGTDKQGERALALLLRPTIMTRTSYAKDRPVAVSMERPFKLGFCRFLWMEEMISVNGQPIRQSRGGQSLDPKALCLRVPLLSTRPGTYPVELRLQYSLGIERASRATTILSILHDGLPWLIPGPAMWQPRRTYECDVTVSSEVLVAEEDDAEKIELTSSPEVDQAMRAAFSAKHAGVETCLSTPAGKRWVTGSAEISYENISLAAAFRMALRLPDGREIPVRGLWPQKLSARAGSSGSFTIDPSSFVVETPGRHRATLVLVSDPNLAHEDPAINAIWNGTLEFPISFRIDANEPRR